MDDEEDAYAAVCGAGRALGYVCASSMYQRVIEKCLDATSDISIYKTNRDLLYNSLTGMGYECVYPDGAFYLFVKAMCDDSHEFCEKAKEHELLLVPGVPKLSAGTNNNSCSLAFSQNSCESSHIALTNK